MSTVVGKAQGCVVLGLGEKNGITDHHPLNLDKMKDLLVVDVDHFLADEAGVEALVRDAVQHRNQPEKNYAELKNERDALLEKVKAVRAIAKDYRVEDRHVCPEDLLAITGE
ncbi:hypothetical protein J7643_00145 [bacterium]|nr:hypothetical protein [bacterium]